MTFTTDATTGASVRARTGRTEARGDVVVVGGSGRVGRRLAAVLAPRLTGRVVLAGRDLPAAQCVAAGIGYGARAVRLDANDPRDVGTVLPTLAGAAVVVTCAPTRTPALAEACLRAGAHYVDVTADGALLSKIEALDPLARAHRAAAVLSVGLAPGLTNLFAAATSTRLDTCERVDLVVALGGGDVHGRAAIAWFLDGLDAEFDVPELDGYRRVRPLSQRRPFALPGGHRPVVGYRFDFPEQRTLSRTLGVPSVSSWLALNPPLAAGALALATRWGLGQLLHRPGVRWLALAALTRVHLGSDRAGVVVSATGTLAGAPAGVTLAATGRGEAALTALVAAAVAEQLLAGDVPPGVLHIEQLTDAATLLARLRHLQDPHAAAPQPQ